MIKSYRSKGKTSVIELSDGVIGLETLSALEGKFSELEADRETDIIILKSTAPCFSCGHDIKELSTYDEGQARIYAAKGQNLIKTMRGLKKIIITLIHGDCQGPGFEIALASDIAFAEKSAKFGFSETNLGFLPGFGGTQLASRKVFETFVKYLVFTGEPVDTAEMLSKGLLSKVFDDTPLMQEEAEKLAEKLSNRSTFALGLAKETVNAGAEMDFDKALLLEQNAFTFSFSCADKREGMSAFIEKRKPEFKTRWEDFND